MSLPLFTFEPTFPDGSPRRWAGMHRPPFDYKMMAEQTKHLPGWIYDNSIPATKWAEGYFDRPLYHVEEHERQSKQQPPRDPTDGGRRPEILDSSDTFVDPRPPKPANPTNPGIPGY